MILDLAEKLVDRCLQLVLHRNDQRRRLFHEHVTPLMDSFQQLHEVYMRTFREAHELISRCDDPAKKVETLAEDLLRDSLFNGSKRSLLVASARALDESDVLSSLVSSIDSYLMTSSYWGFEGGLESLDHINLRLARPIYSLQAIQGVLLNVRAIVAYSGAQPIWMFETVSLSRLIDYVNWRKWWSVFSGILQRSSSHMSYFARSFYAEILVLLYMVARLTKNGERLKEKIKEACVPEVKLVSRASTGQARLREPNDDHANAYVGSVQHCHSGCHIWQATSLRQNLVLRIGESTS